MTREVPDLLIERLARGELSLPAGYESTAVLLEKSSETSRVPAR